LVKLNEICKLVQIKDKNVKTNNLM